MARGAVCLCPDYSSVIFVQGPGTVLLGFASRRANQKEQKEHKEDMVLQRTIGVERKGREEGRCCLLRRGPGAGLEILLGDAFPVGSRCLPKALILHEVRPEGRYLGSPETEPPGPIGSVTWGCSDCALRCCSASPTGPGCFPTGGRTCVHVAILRTANSWKVK